MAKLTKKQEKQQLREQYLDAVISEESKAAISQWDRARGRLSQNQFKAMVDDELLQLHPTKGFFQLTDKGREKYWLEHGEYPSDRRQRRPAMVQYD